MNSRVQLNIIKKPAKLEEENKIISEHLPEIEFLSSNKIRSGIIHLLINSPQTAHSMRVEQISHRLGIRHPIVIHHLEMLQSWDIVEVKKSRKHGNGKRRSVWGLKLDYPNWVSAVYKFILKEKFTLSKLEQFCNRNSNPRLD